MEIDEDGAAAARRVYRAPTRNCAQVAYDNLGAWLEGAAPLPDRARRIDRMEARLRLQHEAAQPLMRRGQRAGTVEFETVKAGPIVENGRAPGFALARKGPAHLVIENFMIAANTAMATFLELRLWGAGSP